MTADRWFVLVAGLALISFIVWFFWLKRSTGARATEVSGGYQEAMILVKGGYTPDTILVRAGKPVRLNFRREETASCSDKVTFADFGKSADLPTGRTVAVELLPKQPGEYAFACPMGMFRGPPGSCTGRGRRRPGGFLAPQGPAMMRPPAAACG